MKRIRLIWVGKTQDAYLDQGIEIFVKKLKPYCDLSVHCLKEARHDPKNPKPSIGLEAERIHKALLPSNYKIFLDETGNSLDSPGLAKRLSKLADSGHLGLDLVIGGAFGLDESLKKEADLLLSLSPMTFTHQMVRLFLLEQLYRAFTILDGRKYHH